MRVTEGAFVADPVLHGSVHLSSSRSSRRDSVPPSKRASRKRGTKAKSPQVGEYEGGRTLPLSVYVRVGPLRLSLRGTGVSNVASSRGVGFPAEVTEDEGFAATPIRGRAERRHRGGGPSGIVFRRLRREQAFDHHVEPRRPCLRRRQAIHVRDIHRR